MERIASRFVLLFLIVSAASAYDVFAQTELQAQDLRVIKGTALESTLQEMLFKYLLRQSEQATAKRLARLARDPELRDRMGRAGREHVRGRYAVERLVNDVDLLYRSLLESTS